MVSVAVEMEDNRTPTDHQAGKQPVEEVEFVAAAAVVVVAAAVVEPLVQVFEVCEVYEKKLFSKISSSKPSKSILPGLCRCAWTTWRKWLRLWI